MKCPVCLHDNLEIERDDDEKLKYDASLESSKNVIIKAWCRDCDYNLNDEEIKEIEQEEKEDNENRY